MEPGRRGEHPATGDVAATTSVVGGSGLSDLWPPTSSNTGHEESTWLST